MATKTTSAAASKSKTAARQELLAEADELLRDLPPLRSAAEFTQRDKGTITKLANRMRAHVDENGVIDMEAEGSVEATMDFFADLDDFFRSLARDEDAYRAWFSSVLKNSEAALGALLARYQAALGE